MYPFKRILVPTDFSRCAEMALHKSLQLARQCRAEVILLHVVAGPPVDDQRINRWLAGVVKNDPKADPETEHGQGMQLRRVVVAHPDPVAAIRDYVREKAIDLVVMGTHGDRAAHLFLSRGSGSLLGRTAEQVVRHAPCPVLTVGSRRYEPVSRILVPVDRSVLSRRALLYARELAALFDAHLALLHVIEARRSEIPAAEDEREKGALAELIAMFKQTKGPVVSVGFHVATGRTDQEIRRFVQQQAIDLIVQGAHSDLGREALGVVAEALVRSVLCPVLTVRGVGERIAVAV